MSKKHFQQIADVYRNFDSPTTVTLGVLWAEKRIAELEQEIEALKEQLALSETEAVHYKEETITLKQQLTETLK